MSSLKDAVTLLEVVADDMVKVKQVVTAARAALSTEKATYVAAKAAAKAAASDQAAAEAAASDRAAAEAAASDRARLEYRWSGAAGSWSLTQMS